MKELKNLVAFARLVILIIMVCLAKVSNSQTTNPLINYQTDFTNVAWVKKIQSLTGSGDGVVIQGMAADTLNPENPRLFITGTFSGNLTLNTTGIQDLTGGPRGAYFLISLDKNGTILMAKGTEGQGHSAGVDVVVDRLGNVYSCGLFGPTTTNLFPESLFPVTSGSFIIKYSRANDYEEEWIVYSRSANPAANDNGFSIIRDIEISKANNRLYALYDYRGLIGLKECNIINGCNSTESTFSWHPGGDNTTQIGLMSIDIFDGRILSTENTHGSRSRKFARALAIDDHNTVYFGGNFNDGKIGFGTNDFGIPFYAGVGQVIGGANANPTIAGATELIPFIFRKTLNEDIKALTLDYDLGDESDPNYAVLSDIDVTSNGDLLISGYFNGEIEFDPASLNGTRLTSTPNLDGGAAKSDLFLARYTIKPYSDNLKLIWALSEGGPLSDEPSEIYALKGKVFVTGNFSIGKPTLEEGEESYNNWAIFDSQRESSPISLKSVDDANNDYFVAEYDEFNGKLINATAFNNNQQTYYRQNSHPIGFGGLVTLDESFFFNSSYVGDWTPVLFEYAMNFKPTHHINAITNVGDSLYFSGGFRNDIETHHIVFSTSEDGSIEIDNNGAQDKETGFFGKFVTKDPSLITIYINEILPTSESDTYEAYSVELWNYEKGSISVKTINDDKQAIFFRDDLKDGEGNLTAIDEIYVLRDPTESSDELLGKMTFYYPEKDAVDQRKKHAIINIHKYLSAYDQHPVYKNNFDWKYKNWFRYNYQKPNSVYSDDKAVHLDGNLHYPTTMFVLPYADSSDIKGYHPKNINPSRQPVVFVHGFTGTDGYWGNDGGYVNPTKDTPDNNFGGKVDYPYTSYPGRLRNLDETSNQRNLDIWEYYYPPDANWIETGYLFGHDLENVLLPNYNEGVKTDIIAHSMGGLVTRSYVENKCYQYLSIGASLEPEKTYLSYTNNIRRVMFLGTPQHGTWSSHLIYHELLINETLLTDLLDKDSDAPASRALGVGCKEYEILNNTENFSSNGVKYVQISGMTKDGLNNSPIPVESPRHEDGIVAMSSANLLNFGVDVGFLPAHSHKHLNNPDTGRDTEYEITQVEKQYIPIIMYEYISSVDGHIMTRDIFDQYQSGGEGLELPATSFTGKGDVRYNVTMPIVRFKNSYSGELWKPDKFFNPFGEGTGEELLDGLLIDEILQRQSEGKGGLRFKVEDITYDGESGISLAPFAISPANPHLPLARTQPYTPLNREDLIERLKDYGTGAIETLPNNSFKFKLPKYSAQWELGAVLEEIAIGWKRSALSKGTWLNYSQNNLSEREYKKLFPGDNESHSFYGFTSGLPNVFKSVGDISQSYKTLEFEFEQSPLPGVRLNIPTSHWGVGWLSSKKSHENVPVWLKTFAYDHTQASSKMLKIAQELSPSRKIENHWFNLSEGDNPGMNLQWTTTSYNELNLNPVQINFLEKNEFYHESGEFAYGDEERVLEGIDDAGVDRIVSGDGLDEPLKFLVDGYINSINFLVYTGDNGVGSEVILVDPSESIVTPTTNGIEYYESLDGKIKGYDIRSDYVSYTGMWKVLIDGQNFLPNKEFVVSHGRDSRNLLVASIVDEEISGQTVVQTHLSLDIPTSDLSAVGVYYDTLGHVYPVDLNDLGQGFDLVAEDGVFTGVVERHGRDTLDYYLQVLMQGEMNGQSFWRTAKGTITGCKLFADFGFKNEPLCVGRELHFQDSTFLFDNQSQTTSMIWDFGDGFTSTEKNPIHQYASTGEFNVELIVRTNTGCTDTVNKTITVYPTPEPSQLLFNNEDVESNPLEVCSNVPAKLSVEEGSHSYAWSEVDDSNNVLADNFEFTPSETGDYFVKVGNQFGCTSNSDTIGIVISKATLVSIAPDGPTTFCPGGTVELIPTVEDEDIVTYIWTREFPEGVFSQVGSNPVYIASDNGNYFLAVENDLGCIAYSDTVEVRVENGLSAPVINVLSDTNGLSFCSNPSDSVVLELTNVEGYSSFEWHVSGSGQSTTTGLSIKLDTSSHILVVKNSHRSAISNSGSPDEANSPRSDVRPFGLAKYYVRAIGGSESCQGLVASNQIFVDIKQPPLLPGMYPFVHYFHEGKNTIYQGSFYGYNHEPSDDAIINAEYTPGKNGLPPIELCVSDGAVATLVGHFHAERSSSRSGFLEAAPNQNTHHYSTSWTKNGEFFSNEPQITLTEIDDAGEYNVVVTNTNNGCIVIDTVTVLTHSENDESLDLSLNNVELEDFQGTISQAYVGLPGKIEIEATEGFERYWFPVLDNDNIPFNEMELSYDNKITIPAFTDSFKVGQPGKPGIINVWAMNDGNSGCTTRSDTVFAQWNMTPFIAVTNNTGDFNPELPGSIFHNSTQFGTSQVLSYCSSNEGTRLRFSLPTGYLEGSEWDNSIVGENRWDYFDWKFNEETISTLRSANIFEQGEGELRLTVTQSVNGMDSSITTPPIYIVDDYYSGFNVYTNYDDYLEQDQEMLNPDGPNSPLVVVCGCNNVTYNSPELARRNGIMKYSLGECSGTEGDPDQLFVGRNIWLVADRVKENFNYIWSIKLSDEIPADTLYGPGPHEITLTCLGQTTITLNAEPYLQPVNSGWNGCGIARQTLDVISPGCGGLTTSIEPEDQCGKIYNWGDYLFVDEVDPPCINEPFETGDLLYEFEFVGPTGTFQAISSKDSIPLNDSVISGFTCGIYDVRVRTNFAGISSNYSDFGCSIEVKPTTYLVNCPSVNKGYNITFNAGYHPCAEGYKWTVIPHCSTSGCGGGFETFTLFPTINLEDFQSDLELGGSYGISVQVLYNTNQYSQPSSECVFDLETVRESWLEPCEQVISNFGEGNGSCLGDKLNVHEVDESVKYYEFEVFNAQGQSIGEGHSSSSAPSIYLINDLVTTPFPLTYAETYSARVRPRVNYLGRTTVGDWGGTCLFTVENLPVGSLIDEHCDTTLPLSGYAEIQDVEGAVAYYYEFKQGLAVLFSDTIEPEGCDSPTRIILSQVRNLLGEGLVPGATYNVGVFPIMENGQVSEQSNICTLEVSDEQFRPVITSPECDGVAFGKITADQDQWTTLNFMGYDIKYNWEINSSTFDVPISIITETGILNVLDIPGIKSNNVCSVRVRYIIDDDLEGEFSNWCSISVKGINANGDISLCEEEEIELIAAAGESYLWSTGATTREISVDRTGSYSVQIKSSTGTVFQSETINVSINEVVFGGEIGGEQNVCFNSRPESVFNILPATGGDGQYLYEWYERENCEGDWKLIPGENGLNYTPPSEVSIDLCYVRFVRNRCNNQVSNIVRISVADSLIAGSIGADQEICAPVFSNWTRVVGLIESGTLIRKGEFQPLGWNAGAISVQNLKTGNYLSTTILETNKNRALGISYENSDESLTTIEYAILFNDKGFAHITKRGEIVLGSKVAYKYNDVFKLELHDNGIYFYKNDQLYFDLSEEIVDPTIVDVSLKDPGSTLNKVTIGEIPKTIESLEPASGGLGDLMYQWESQLGCLSNNWYPIENTDMDMLTPINMDGSYCYRRMVTDACDTVYSNIVHVMTKDCDDSITSSRTLGEQNENIISASDSYLDLLKIFPNPISHGLLHVSIEVSTDLQVSSLEIYDISGNVIRRFEQGDLSLVAGQKVLHLDIDFDSLPEGIYMVYLNTDSGLIGKRLIVMADNK
ncbi:Por secretion system C-terminal sorting domain-containing protein [Reichenbachiella faecimaris]|uniref:Por secretion system C-terminal sorting domain-containing protein n=1 Tax=Reichenbachiella faecimaris TaxID=692418 RepID=A0A1W2GIC0_REIFA|nr:PKD domain-containing protein [Reichenbachiella faecimaris]SMD36036.1 Por secretion system C-terminal sorting domain-containing protein [Reichenbachiella faecimaris]